MIRECLEADFEAIREVINDGACAYENTISPELYREPWMSAEYLRKELLSGVKFIGWEEGEELHGVMGAQEFRDVTVIRHSYVRTAWQRQGIGGKLLRHRLAVARRPVLVGCLKKMVWAIAFYQQHGFTLVSDAKRDELRARYWTLPPEHVAQSVVLVQ